jgi:hypothetical protein
VGGSYETHSTRIDKPKIPDVCDAEGIETIDLIEVVRREGWSFRSP